ncbi:MAG: hypothetical protein WCF04_13810 [Candidatus Nanopelagicales bacterium]
MNPRLALVMVLGLAVVLVFVGWLLAQRRTTSGELESRRRQELIAYDRLVAEIQSIARSSLDVDPSAALIDSLITSFNRGK